MLYRRFGRTEIAMPVLSCGGMRYQHKWQDVPLDQIPAENQENLENTIRRALELGINHSETARGYGASERQLGRILPKLPRRQIIVQTKVAPAETPDEFTRNFEDSLSRLGLDYVDLMAIHGINNRETLERSIRAGGCLEAARAIQRRGLARHIGFSTHGPTEVMLQAVNCDRAGGFDYVNLHWYYIYQKNFPAIEAASRRDMGIFIISPSDKGGMLYDPPARLVELCHPLHPAVFNDMFCLSCPLVHTISVGAARPTDFGLHLQAVGLLDRAAEFLPPILSRLDAALREAVEPELLDPFGMGLPDWENTPGQINIPVILWLRNLVKAFDLRRYAEMRYNLLGQGGHWFPGQTAAKLDEVDLAPVLRGIPLAERIPDFLREAHALLGRQSVKRLSESS